jgi:small subunit ribosomal protein S2
LAIVDVKEIIEAGVHFGHRVSRWHPRMAPFIFGKRNLIHIIDVRETLKGIVRAANFLTQVAALGKEVVFVGTKRQARALIQRTAEECGMHWVSERWLGGTLTNFHTVRGRLRRLEDLEALEQSGEIENYSKKQISRVRRERRKILRNLEGLRRMNELPGCLVVIDIRREHIAVLEARKCGIPVVGLVDTDCDPRLVDIVIPGNDDAYRSIQIVLKVLKQAVVAGRDRYAKVRAEEEKARLEEEVVRKEAEAARLRAARETAPVPPIGSAGATAPGGAMVGGAIGEEASNGSSERGAAESGVLERIGVRRPAPAPETTAAD